MAVDELEIAGVFVRENSMRSLNHGRNERLILSIRNSDVFDELYAEERGETVTDNSAPLGFFASEAREAIRSRLEEGLARVREVQSVRSIGRNEPCPCDSGLKFKRCHGGRYDAGK
jgi:hypothetical protein